MNRRRRPISHSDRSLHFWLDRLRWRRWLHSAASSRYGLPERTTGVSRPWRDRVHHCHRQQRCDVSPGRSPAPPSPCGTFSSATTASGAATTYTAPAAPTTVMITAAVASGTPGTAQISIAVPPISVAFNPAPPTSLPAGTTTPLTAVVSNDSKNAGVTWTVTCGSSGACGSFIPTSTASGTATTYTAPAAIPTGNTVMVTATSVTDTTKSQSATITIGAPPAILANGTYVYHFSGWDSTGPSFFAGAFTVAGGVITGGEQDFSDATTNDPGQPLWRPTAASQLQAAISRSFLRPLTPVWV